jgi:hypothetical protein
MRSRSRRLAPTMGRRHLIGLLLATENDWPAALESVLSHRLDPLWRGDA